MQLLKILMYWQDGYKHLFIPYIYFHVIKIEVVDEDIPNYIIL